MLEIFCKIFMKIFHKPTILPENGIFRIIGSEILNVLHAIDISRYTSMRVCILNFFQKL